MNEDTFFKIEKVLKKKNGKAHVRWKSWPSNYDSWVDQKYLFDLKISRYRVMQAQSLNFTTLQQAT